MIFDLGNLLVNLWKTWKQDREWQAWLRLILSITFSGIIALTGVTGEQLAAGTVWLVSLGYGLVAASISMTTVLLTSPQGRSLVTSLPQSVIRDYQEKDQTTITGKEASK